MKYALYNKKTNKKEEIEEEEVIKKIYKEAYYVKDEKTKKEISKIRNYIPLYDIYSDNMYLRTSKDIGNCVFKYNYRFPTRKFIKNIQEKIKEDKQILMILEYDDIEKDMIELIKENIHRYELMIEYLDNFDNDILLNTYKDVLYDTERIGRAITLHKRPSFNPKLKHIKPYYTVDEIICISLNNKIITQEEVNNLTNDDIRDLYEKIKSTDINYKNIIEHHKKIIDTNRVGLIQYYSLTGFNKINYYLRHELIPYNEQNETIIRELNTLIETAPLLDKEYIVYRFIQSDDFLENLKEGDVFTERGFLSTTRNPFYKQSTTSITFGWILMKIHIPKNVHVLSIESLSFYPQEQEIIFKPNTKLKLISKDDNTKYYHTDKSIEQQITKKYEFEVINDKDEIDIIRPKEEIPEIEIDKIKIMKTKTMKGKIIEFEGKYTNSYGQYKIKTIKGREIIITTERYNSVGIYKKYFWNKTDDGYYMYSIYNNEVIFMIEITEDKLVVNYNVEFIRSTITDEELLDIINKIGKMFNIPEAIIYCNYNKCETECKMKIIGEKTKLGGKYNYDISEYIKKGTKRFNNKAKAVFDYNTIDKIMEKEIEIDKYTKDDTDNIIYRIYKHGYIGGKKMKDFYLWLLENNCYYIEELEKQLGSKERINPFKIDYYEYNIMKKKVEGTKLMRNIQFDRYGEEPSRKYKYVRS